MPIYEYACKKCHQQLDALPKMSDDPSLECPECGEPALKRLLSAPRFRLKGKGWYETDFKKDNQRNVHKPETEPAKSDKAESKADKSETKKTKKESGSSSASKADKK